MGNANQKIGDGLYLIPRMFEYGPTEGEDMNKLMHEFMILGKHHLLPKIHSSSKMK